MSRLDRLSIVLDVACLTVDRSPVEQRAMLALALRVDLDRGAFTMTNHHLRARPSTSPG